MIKIFGSLIAFKNYEKIYSIRIIHNGLAIYGYFHDKIKLDNYLEINLIILSMVNFEKIKKF